MKNKLLKIGAISVVALIGISSFSIAKAEDDDTTKECVTHRDYFFLNQLHKTSDILDNESICSSGGSDDSNLANCNGSIEAKQSFAAYFPNINKIKADDIKKQGQICLKKGSITQQGTQEVTGETDCQDSWDLEEEYFPRWRLAATKESEEVTYNDTTYKYRVYETEENGVTIRYITHVAFYSVDGKSKVGDGETVVDDADDSELAAASLFADGDYQITDGKKVKTPYFGELVINDTIIKASIARSYTGALVQKSNLKSFKHVWVGDNGSGGVPINTLISPALYYIEYDVCEDDLTVPDPEYSSDITYKCVDENGEEVDCTGGNPDPDHRDGLEDGYTHDVDSPKIKGCTPDKETVKIKIEGKDFKEEVIYTCAIPNNYPTGSFLIVIAWIVGLGALGYSGYYFYKLKKLKSV